jgi:hypothetical protein
MANPYRAAIDAAAQAIAGAHCLDYDDARRIAVTALEAATPLIVTADREHSRAALKRHMHKLTDSRGDCCAGCLYGWPCPDAPVLGERES